MIRKKTFIIVFFSGLILLISGVGTSYFWLTRIYLPQQTDSNMNALLFNDWMQNDLFKPPGDDQITHDQIEKFILINESLSFLVYRLRRQFADNSWQIAFNILKMQPEWTGHKYLALKKIGMSPREYEWISNLVVKFWIYRWKEESLEKLRELGWQFESFSSEKNERPVNYDLLLDHENELNRLFNILWSEKSQKNYLIQDSLIFN